MTDTRDPRMHDGTWTGKRPAYLPEPQSSPIQQAHAAADKQWPKILDQAAQRGEDSPINRDPRELAQRVSWLTKMALVEEHPSADTWARIIAWGLAGWCASARAEDARFDTGAD